MGSLAQSSNFQNCIKTTNKMPEYARDYRKEWLFIRGINKECEKFVNREDSIGELFKSSQAKNLQLYFRKFLKAQENEYLQEISEFYFGESDVKYISILDCQLDDFMDFLYPENNDEIEWVYQEFLEFYDFFKTFFSKINIKEMTYSDFERELDNLSDYSYLSSDSDSD